MKQKTLQNEPCTYNEAVHSAYNRIIKMVKLMIGTIERDELRCMFERKSIQQKPNTIMHELVSPLLYIRLECDTTGTLVVYFGIEPLPIEEEYARITAKFLRTLFWYTAKEQTNCNIEHCIKTGWFINVCSETYEYIEMQQKHHTHKKVPYVTTASKRKGELAVA